MSAVAAATTAPKPLLTVRGVTTYYGKIIALRGVDLDVAPGEALGVVGETGCGKTVTGLAAMRLLPRTARLTAGALRFELLSEGVRVKPSSVKRGSKGPSRSHGPKGRRR